eukprot:790620-Rhodomonas_salina.1
MLRVGCFDAMRAGCALMLAGCARLAVCSSSSLKACCAQQVLALLTRACSAQIPFDEIVNKTEGFAAQYQIGRGRGWGTYVALELERMNACAVKPLGRPEVGADVDKLTEQVGELGPCRHENLLPLLGTSLQEGEHQVCVCVVARGPGCEGRHALRAGCRRAVSKRMPAPAAMPEAH